jgi:hypothetical protein
MAAGEMDYPRRRGQAGEEAFPGYLRQARAILAAVPTSGGGTHRAAARFRGVALVPAAPACLQGHCEE